MNSSTDAPSINVVDLFCGCGGLSCGFDFYGGNMRFRTVLGIDNYPAAIKIFNANFASDPGACLPIGRLTDMTWFSHPAEIRLYYLVHSAYSKMDTELDAELRKLGIEEFLTDLRTLDEQFAMKASHLSDRPEYRESSARVPSETSALALPQAVMASLALSSLSKPTPNLQCLPWSEEYRAILTQGSPKGTSRFRTDSELIEDSRDLLLRRLAQLREAASKKGTGQNRNNAARLIALVQFFDSAPAQELWDLWIAWHSARASIRASFCLVNEESINHLYSGSRRVHVILGGPPCKGFSRIGRPVIQALRDQGVHAWSHKEYGDERNSLMCQYVLFLEALAPDLFLFENVSNFQSVLKTPAGELDAPAMLEELIGELSEGHVQYHVHHRLVNARNFAVPQDRRRFIMVGINARKAPIDACLKFFAFEESVDDVQLKFALIGLSEPAVFQSSDGVKTDHRSPTYRVRDESMTPALRRYFSWIQQPAPSTGEYLGWTTAHIYREPRPDDRAFINFIAPGVRWMDLKVSKSDTISEIKALGEAAAKEGSASLRELANQLLRKIDDSLMLRLLLEHTQEMYNLPEQHLLLEGYLKNGGSTHGDWLERLSANKPCKTIVAHIGKDTYGYWHPTEPRALTIREAARVQSFPDFFRFDSAGVVDTYAAIGNAVPPLLSAAFAKRTEELNLACEIFSDELRFEAPVLMTRVHATQMELVIAD